MGEFVKQGVFLNWRLIKGRDLKETSRNTDVCIQRNESFNINSG